MKINHCRGREEERGREGKGEEERREDGVSEQKGAGLVPKSGREMNTHCSLWL